MSKALYCKVSVQKDMSHAQSVECFTHEIPIYQAKYGGNVVLLPDEDQPKDKFGEPLTKKIRSVADEFARLEAKHGEIEEGLSAVGALYHNPLTGGLKKMIGEPASTFFHEEVVDEDEDDEDSLDPGEPADQLLEGLPTGNPTKKVLEDWLKSIDHEYDDSMSAPELLAYAGSVIPSFIKAAEPDLELPDTKVNGLIELYDRITGRSDTEQLVLNNGRSRN